RSSPAVDIAASIVTDAELVVAQAPDFLVRASPTIKIIVAVTPHQQVIPGRADQRVVAGRRRVDEPNLSLEANLHLNGGWDREEFGEVHSQRNIAAEFHLAADQFIVAIAGPADEDGGPSALVIEVIVAVTA